MEVSAAIGHSQRKLPFIVDNSLLLRQISQMLRETHVSIHPL